MVKTKPKVPKRQTPSPSTPKSQTKKKAASTRKTKGQKSAPRKSSRKYVSDLQTRSTMMPIIRIFNGIRHQLNQGHFDAMSKTPFFLLFKAIYDRKLTTLHCKKNEKIIVSIIERFNKDTQMFKLGSQEVGIYADDVRFVFGLVDGPRHIEICRGGKLEWRFANRVFSGAKGKLLTMKLLKSRLTEVVNTEGDVAVEDTVRILSLIIICSLFCPARYGLAWGWVEYVENLEEMKTYDWCETILNVLVKSMIDKHEQPINVQGCTTFLMYWLCEHTRIANPRGLAIPRVLKWRLDDVWKKIDKDILKKLSNDEVIEGALTPTIEELNEYKKLQIVIRQAHSGGENNVEEVSSCNENSMYRKIEEKKRKPPKKSDYDYGKGRKKSTKSQLQKEHVEVENCNISVYNDYTCGQVKFLEKIDKNSTGNCGWNLPPKCLEKLILLFKKGKTAPVVHNREKWFHVNVGDILNIMSCRYVNNGVIDAYAHHLLETSNLDTKTFVVQSLCWSSIVKERPVDNPIYKQVADASTIENAVILFPMCSTGYNKETRPFHWTLLEYDVSRKEYIFYNSMKPRMHRKDAFCDDAKVMKELIEENVGKLLNLDGESDFLKLETPKYIPQQGAGTNDCGIYVCYFMKQIIQKKKIPKSISKDDLQMFKAEIVKAIVMNNQKS